MGPYEILGPLGAGGMGEVYRARDARLGREVAVKVLRDEHAADPAWLSRFEREARLLAALNHPNIATVHGLDEAAGVRYLAMELVTGETLAGRLAGGPLPLAEGLGICRQIALALEAAHEQGIIHRDLKPANVMITPDDRVKVLDFGLARSTHPRAGLADRTTVQDVPTGEGAICGTPAYMAPEQARGKPVDRRCDIWAFGCVLYEAITGTRPFSGETFSDTLAAVIERTPDWKTVSATAPPRIAELVRRCLQKDAQKRLRDIGDARLEIDDALAELAQPRPIPEPPRPARRSVLPAITLAVVALALGVGLGLLLPGRSSPAGAGEAAVAAIPADWSGQLLLGGTTRAFGPRASPDGQWLAFTVLQEGQAQVGVMKLGSGEWWVLTRDPTRGPVNSVSWSADSARIYFDRFFDLPMGVYSVSPLDIAPGGARERLVIGAAECPQVVADGSLLVCKLDEDGNYRLHRHWPGADRPTEAVGPAIEFDIGWPPPVRALRKSNRVVFCGKIIDPADPSPRRRFYLLDLDTGTYRPLPAGDVPLNFVQLAVSADDRFVCTVLPADDLFRVVRISLHDDGPPQAVLTLTTRVFGLDIDHAGRMYLDQFQRPLELLRFRATGGAVERLVSLPRRPETGTLALPVELPDGRTLVPSRGSGRSRLLALLPGKEPRPILEHASETMPPVVLIDNRHLAFVGGSDNGRQVRLAALEDDHARVIAAVKGIPTEGLMRLTPSPDGKALYYVHARQVWEVPLKEGGSPRKVGPGDGVAVHPATGELLIQRFEKAGVRLYQVPAKGGPRREVKLPQGPVRLVPYGIGDRSIDQTGRVLVGATSKDTWFWRVAVLDLKAGKLDLIPVDFDGEIYPATWTRDGKVLAMGFPIKSELWRLTPRP